MSGTEHYTKAADLDHVHPLSWAEMALFDVMGYHEVRRCPLMLSWAPQHFRQNDGFLVPLRLRPFPVVEYTSTKLLHALPFLPFW
jgi:hypothetical protein